MQQGPDQFGAYNPIAEQKPRRGMPWWGWLITSVVILIVLPCFGCIGWVTYIGAVGPGTMVYTGNQMPQSYLDIITDVGALEPDENIHYFFSDALTDIRNGFYFVSDRRIVVYSEYNNSNAPLTTIGFDEVQDANLSRDTALFGISTIYIDLKDGTPIAIPVSSENDGDVRFFDAIQENLDTVSP